MTQKTTTLKALRQARSFLDELYGGDKRVRDHTVESAKLIEYLPQRDELVVTFDLSKEPDALPLEYLPVLDHTTTTIDGSHPGIPEDDNDHAGPDARVIRDEPQA